MTVFRIPSTLLRLNQPIGKADIGIVVYQSSIWFVGLLSAFVNFSILTTYLIFSVQPIATNHSQNLISIVLNVRSSPSPNDMISSNNSLMELRNIVP